MLNLDDEQFEAYLKSFRPVAPNPLPGAYSARRSRFSAMLVAAVLVPVLIGVAAVRLRRTEHVAVLEGGQPSILLTFGSANRLIATAPSIEEALDSLNSRGRGAPVPVQKRSALAVLAKQSGTL